MRTLDSHILYVTDPAGREGLREQVALDRVTPTGVQDMGLCGGLHTRRGDEHARTMRGSHQVLQRHAIARVARYVGGHLVELGLIGAERYQVTKAMRGGSKASYRHTYAVNVQGFHRFLC